MKAASNLIMWLTLVLLLTLAMVFCLVLLLFVELYCSPLIRLRRHRRQVTTPPTNSSSTYSQSQSQSESAASSPSPLHSLTTPGTGSFLHPTDSGNDIEKQLPQPLENQESSIQKGASVHGWPLLYISNPIYDEENGRGSRARVDDDDTPFETPDTSPSRWGTDEEVATTPPLTPTTKLLKDGRSLGAWGSDTNSNNGVSSSSSLTPCTSPSS